MSISASIAEFVSDESDGRICELIDALERRYITLASGRPTIERAIAHNPRSLDRITTILAEWRNGGGSETLLVENLRSLVTLRRTLRERQSECELVWSGLGATPGVRTTASVIPEMIGRAQQSIVYAAYSVWVGYAKAGDLIRQMADLSSAGVDVTFIVDDRYEGGHNVVALQRAWPRVKRRPEVYTWQHREDDTAKLHAKVLVVDRRDLLVTSANLTGHGLAANLELGLRVRGFPAEQTSRRLDELIRSGVFQRVEWR